MRCLILICLVGFFYAAQSACPGNQLATYKMVLNTEWSRERFPKQYPEWRPNAQWSKVVGRTHSDSYRLWQLGELASPGVKSFSEVGKSDELDSGPKNGILDDFYAPPITTGVGKTEAQIFVDGNHSKVSLISRIVPSPDWFIGIDSFDLCSEEKWLDAVTLDLGPLDAGTQNGFMFTSPKWSSDPPESISAITAHYPDHQANSFFYPNLPKLPRLAYLQLLKTKEYVLRDVFEHDSSRNVETVVSYKKRGDAKLPVYRTAEVYQKDEAPVKLSAKKKSNDNSVINSVEARRVGRKHRKNMKRPRKPRDCRVSEWSEWSECSKSCGFGEKTRERMVIKHAGKRGRPCPVLSQKEWCGSARNCRSGASSYFDWDNASGSGHH